MKNAGWHSGVAVSTLRSDFDPVPVRLMELDFIERSKTNFYIWKLFNKYVQTSILFCNNFNHKKVQIFFLSIKYFLSELIKLKNKVNV